ncbi:MAG: P-loop NTPase [Clostridia bacterium]|nr:P-loop NTPase [Clostridia bacterium]
MNQTTENKKDIFVTVYLNDIIKGLQRFWWVCVAAAVLFGGFGALYQKLNYVPEYESSVTLTVNTQNESATVSGVSVYTFYYDSNTASLLSSTFPYILNYNLLQEAICEDLGTSYMPARLSATAVPGTNMFTITAKGADPQLTYDVLQAALENYPHFAKYVVGSITFEILKQPVIAVAPSNGISYVNEFVKGAAIGLFFGLLFIFVYILQRKTVKTKFDIKNQLNLDALSIVPQVSFKKRAMPGDKALLFTNPDIGSSFPEAFRVLRNVFISSLKENEKIIMATSSVPGEGKTTIITNLALALADHGKNILLFDADIRHPSIAPLLGLDTEEIEYETVTELYKIAFIKNHNLSILLPIANKDTDTGYMNSNDIKKIFDEFRDLYDYILVDTPPCGLISDALFIAQHADATVFVTYQDVVRISRVRKTIDSLMSTDIRILGCVLNGTVQGFSGYGYGYGYGYGKYGYGYGYGKYGYSKYGYDYGYGEASRESKNKSRKKKKHE